MPSDNPARDWRSTAGLNASRHCALEMRALAGAIRSTRYVAGLTHNFYRYPARFPPDLARELIREFTKPGDLVLDPFMGGGTTIVEAVALGRRAVGVDINPIACFVSAVKTTPLSHGDAEALRFWAQGERQAEAFEGAASDPRTRNLPAATLPVLGQYAWAARALRPRRRSAFARCVLLNVGQWAVDGRRERPPDEDLRSRIVETTEKMLRGLADLLTAAAEHGLAPGDLRRARRLVLTSAARRYWLRSVRRMGAPRLVVTSPPYPGVHILYHRWQVASRRETPAPFWLADLRDGHGGAHYTFGSRTPLGMRNYFESLKRSFVALREIVDSHTLVSQLVAFSDVAAQLPRYLQVLNAAGFEEASLDLGLGTLTTWRTVPHRKWYTSAYGNVLRAPAGKELFLLHKPSGRM